MANCSKGSKEIGVNFTTAVKIGTKNGTLNPQAVKMTLTSSLNDRDFDPLAIAHVIEGAMKVKQSMIRKLTDLTNIEDIKAFVEANLNPDEALVANNLQALATIPGFEAFDASVETLNKVANKEVVSVPSAIDVYVEVANEEEEDGIVVNANTVSLDSINVSDPKTFMQNKLSERTKKTEGLKDGASDFWSPFLSTYFPGMSGVGADFVEHVKDKIFSAIIDNTSTMGGFIDDIDVAINKIKRDIETSVAEARYSTPYTAEKIDSALLNTNTDQKIRYMNEVFAIDFDFILHNMIRSITVSKKRTISRNSIVSGFLTETSGELVLNIKAIPEMFIRLKGNTFMLRDTLPNGKEVPHVMNEVDKDSRGFANDSSILNNAFYHTSVDNKYFFKDGKGTIVDISPVTYYAYNSSSNRNQNSIDHFIGAFDSDSSFIQNLLQMFKQVVPNEVGQFVLGERMGMVDYLTLAPYLTNAGNNLESFIPKLQALAAETDSHVGRIANSILVHMFSKTATQMADGTQIHSIFQSVNKNGILRGNINNNIIAALHSALISKDNVRYLVVNNNNTQLTKGLGTGSEAVTVNTELAGILMTDGYTKATIADAIVVSGKTFSIKLPFKKEPISIDNVDTIEKVQEVARAVGLTKEFDDIHNKFRSVYTTAKADNGALITFKNILNISAINKAGKEYLKPKETEIDDTLTNDLYIRRAPSTVILGDELKVLASLYNVNSHKSVMVGGVMTASTSAPNRDSRIPNQLEKYNDYNRRVNAVKVASSPFLNGTHPTIPKATFKGVVIKTPIEKNGEIIGLADWNEKVRVEHALIHGFLKAPKNVGMDFLIQPVNYSDKSNIEMMEIFVGENLLANNADTQQKLIAAYIEYNASKNEEIQRNMIHSLKEFVVGNYSKLYNEISSSTDSANRLANLAKLRELLLKDYSEASGDMTRAINLVLAEVKIHPDLIEYSDTNIDMGSDIISMPGNPDTAILKPHLGVRAALYRNPIKAQKEVNDALYDNRSHMNALRINVNEVNNAIKNVKTDVVTDINSLYDRFYLINGIYGHNLKVLTVADESYFSANYGKFIKDGKESIADYYFNVDSGKRNGLEESEQMLASQFKRAQSILTRGSSYSEKTTIEGVRRKHAKNNIISYMDIIGDNKVVISDEGSLFPGSVFDFGRLAGKTLLELEGLGIVSRFNNGTLVTKNDLGYLVRFNVGTDSIIIGDYVEDAASIEMVASLKEQGAHPQLVDGLFKFVKDVISATKADVASTAAGILDGTPLINNTLQPTFIANVTGREHALTVDILANTIANIQSNGMVVLPDLIPSITITDPVSFVDILNAVGNEQENSDGVQFMHPLMSLIYKHARGKDLGAFNTDNEEALKLLTTTFEYDKMRHILQKKSVQMPFTHEQMRKLGGIELYNAFKSMNTAITFKQPTMNFVEIVGSFRADPVIYTANNLHELYKQVVSESGGYGVSDNAVWSKVLEILRQNPINMYSFVGLLTLPSAQKTGQKKINKFSNVFSRTDTTDKPNIDYTASEFSYEVLTKAHDYDVSGAAMHASTLTLLSQLVNATSFGGLSNAATMKLHNAMGAKMMINRFRVGQDLAEVAQKLKQNNGGNEYDTVINKLKTGDVSVEGYSAAEKDAYDDVLRAGVYEMANLAFQKNDSVLIQKVIQGVKTIADSDGNTLEIPDSYSLDSPAVRAKVMGTLRSAFFQDTVKMKMSGFMGTVSATHKTINIFTLPNGKRVGRQGFITSALSAGIPANNEGAVVRITKDNHTNIAGSVLPFDIVSIVYTLENETLTTPIFMPFGDVPMSTINDPRSNITAVLTPDVTFDASLSVERYFGDELDEHTPILFMGGRKPKAYSKWYLNELYSKEQIIDFISTGTIAIDVAEKFSLQWYKYKDVSGKDLRSTDAYKQMYRAALDKNTSESKMNEVRALVILETQRKDAEGKPVWFLTDPEVVLPTYISAAFNLPKGASITDVIGVDGNDRINAAKFFSKDTRLEAKFRVLSKQIVHYTDMVKRIYNRKLVLEKNSYDSEVLAYLNKYEHGLTISPSGVISINEIILRHKKEYVETRALNLADNFLSMLEVVLTRVPGQSKQSGFKGRVVEFLDAQGNAAFAPTEHMVTTGGDFDIDTLSVLTKTIDKNGVIHTATEGFNIKNVQEAYKQELEATQKDINKKIDASNTKSLELIAAREKEVAAALEGEDTSLIEKRSKQLENAKNLIIHEEERAKILKKVRRQVHAKYDSMTSNTVAEGVFRALDSVDTAVELNTPMSMSMFNSIIARIENHKAEEKRKVALPTVSREYAWAQLKDEPVFGYGTVNVMKSKNRRKPEEHFASPFTLSGANNTIAVGRHVLPEVVPKKGPKAIEYNRMLEENNQDLLTAYNEWLTMDLPVSSVTQVYGSPIILTDVEPDQREWAMKQIKQGHLDGKKLLYMSDVTGLRSYADELVDIVSNRSATVRSGENYSSIFFYENLAAQGKESIGMFATTIKINSGIQTAKINYDTTYSGEDRMTLNNPFYFLSTIQYTNFITGKEEKRTRTGFADLDRFDISRSVAKSTALQETIASIMGTNKLYNKDSIQTLINVLNIEIDKELKNAILENPNVPFGPVKKAAAIKELVQSLFRIDVMEEAPEVLLSSDPVAAFKKFLQGSPDLVAQAFSNVIGKQLSNDVESQFLSAATDNAKVLILGKIKSNQITNPIISTMLLLGYDVDSIIDFLYDKDVTRVLDFYSNKVSDLQSAALNKTEIEKTFGSISPSINSLLDMIAVSEEVAKFRSVRSLNEATQIESYKLDRILSDVDPKLYEAIMKDKIELLRPPVGAEKIFNPSMMIFLHPQSRYLFVQLYESEKYKIPSLFNTTSIVSEIAGRGSRNMNSYKAIDSFLSAMQVESYLNKSIEFTKADGTVASAQRTGVEVTKDGAGMYTKKRRALSTPPNRASFVSSFETYLEYAKDELFRLTGSRNIALDNLGRGRTYNSTNTVFYVPKIKNANIDSVDVSLIHEGINELKTITGNKEVDTLQREIYNNLSLYSLIVSAGGIKKGSMTELYEEINLSLAEHIKDLKPVDYKKMVPTMKFIQDVVKDNVREESVVIADVKKGVRQSEDELEMERELSSMDDFDLEMDQDVQDEEGNFIKTRALSPNMAPIYRAVIGNKYTEGTLFRLPSTFLPKDIFYAYKQGEIAYRLFPSDNSEALPNTTVVSDIKFSRIPPKITKELALVGLQVGFSAKYNNGNDVRILAYAGIDEIGAQYYLIAHNTGTKKVAGAHLMNANPDLYLNGNIIQKVNSFNLKNALKKQADNQVMAEKVSNVMIPMDIVITTGISGVFTDAEIHSDPIISKESRVAGTAAANVILLKDGSSISDKQPLARYHNNVNIEKAGEGSRSALIPAIWTRIGSQGMTEKDIANELMDQVMGMLNNLSVKEKLSLYGISSNINLSSFSKEEVVAGGIDIFDHILKSTKGKDKYTIINKAFSVERTFDEVSGITRLVITKVRPNIGNIFVNGLMYNVTGVKSEDGSENVKSKEWLADPVKVKALESGILKALYKKLKMGIAGKAVNAVAIRTSENEDGYEMYVKETKHGYDDMYYRIKAKGTGVVYDSTANEVQVPDSTYKTLLDVVKSDKGEFINKNCN